LKPLRGSSNKKTLYSTRLCVNWAFFGTRGPLKRSFHSRFKMVHPCQKGPNLHTNKLLFLFDTVRIWEFSPVWTDFDKYVSQFVKTKRQANFKDLKQFGAFNVLVGTKRSSFVCKLGLFLALVGLFKTLVSLAV
jgi:hypothetical protein